jgi:hypothetical protein
MLGTMSQDHSAAGEPTIFTSYEIDYMLSLSTSRAAGISREQIGIPGVPGSGAAAEHVTAAVNAGLRARGKLVRRGGEWVLGEEGERIAGVLTGADRWLGIALAQGEAMRAAFVVKADRDVLMLTQDDLDSFQITSLGTPDRVPAAVARVATTFLRQGAGHTVNLRRTDASDERGTAPLMLHVETDGTWQCGHLPMSEDGVLTVSPIAVTEVESTIADLWERGESTGEEPTASAGA